MKHYDKLEEALAERFGDRVTMVANDPEALKELSPTGEFRHGAFEITDVKSKENLYTKLGSGLHVTEKKQWIDKFLDDVAATCGVA
mmetsp:Transcript_80614/g.236906  ORF Transcript_80614/g.236906 Transcript_80614/m.236906 type:complete len:86 (-) Transcript_80614:380-637(-)